MDPFVKLSHDVQAKIDKLGDAIIGFAQKKNSILKSRASDADKAEQISAARSSLERAMETVFGKGEGSISRDIECADEACRLDKATAASAGKALGIWREELPNLKRFLEYCTAMIEEHPGDATPQVRKSQKCITKATVVLGKISNRIDEETKV